jgi:hypothetical protein
VELLKPIRWTIALVLAALSPAGAQSATEYEIKAAFLYRFASFVEWPPEESEAPVTICIAGDNPFGGALERVLHGKTLNGREFIVRALNGGGPPGDCRILFVSQSERKRLKPVLERYHGRRVLTVGDVPGFCETGGVVNFEVVNDRVQFEINPDAAGRAGLQLSSRLLSLARIVRDPGAPGR